MTETPEPEGFPVELVGSTANPMLRLVAFILGSALLVALVGIIALAVLAHPIPDVLQNLAVGAMSALAALLVGNRSA